MIISLFSRRASESYKRSLVKTLSWRFIAALDTFAIAFVVTGKMTGAAAIVSVEAVTKIVWYYLHERGWDHITWGRDEPLRLTEYFKNVFRRSKSKS